MNTGSPRYVFPYNGTLRLLNYSPVSRVIMEYHSKGKRVDIGSIDSRGLRRIRVVAGDHIQFSVRYPEGRGVMFKRSADDILFAASYEYTVNYEAGE